MRSLALVLLLVGGPALAQQPAAPGAIRITFEPRFPQPGVRASAAGAEATTSTNLRGCVLGPLAPGEHVVRFEKPGRVPTLVPVRLRPGQVVFLKVPYLQAGRELKPTPGATGSIQLYLGYPYTLTASSLGLRSVAVPNTWQIRNVPPGEHRIRLVRNPERLEIPVSVVAGQQSVVSLNHHVGGWHAGPRAWRDQGRPLFSQAGATVDLLQAKGWRLVPDGQAIDPRSLLPSLKAKATWWSVRWTLRGGPDLRAAVTLHGQDGVAIEARARDLTIRRGKATFRIRRKHPPTQLEARCGKGWLHIREGRWRVARLPWTGPLTGLSLSLSGGDGDLTALSLAELSAPPPRTGGIVCGGSETVDQQTAMHLARAFPPQLKTKRKLDDATIRDLIRLQGYAPGCTEFQLPRRKLLWTADGWPSATHCAMLAANRLRGAALLKGLKASGQRGTLLEAVTLLDALKEYRDLLSVGLLERERPLGDFVYTRGCPLFLEALKRLSK